MCHANEVPLCFERKSGERYHRRNCGIVFIDNAIPVNHYPVNALSEKRQRAGFIWDYRSNKLRSIARSHTRWILNHLENRPLPCQPRALSVGCAYAHDLYELHRSGWQVLGVDRDASFRERARRQYGIEVRTNFFEDLETDFQFDLVIMASVLPYLSGVTRVMDRLSSLVRPGGWLFITKRNIDHCEIADVLSYPMNIHARQYFTTKGLTEFARARQFEPLFCESFMVRHPFMTRILPKVQNKRLRKVFESLANLQHITLNALGNDCYRPSEENSNTQVRFLAQRR